MSTQQFNFSPTVEVLQKLVQPAILINGVDIVTKAVRIWYTLRQFYAPSPSLKQDTLTHIQWREFLFEDAAHSHKRDALPSHEDARCLCGKTIPEILFSNSDRISQWQQWQASFIEAYQFIRDTAQIKELLAQIEVAKPFYLTGKALTNDLKSLAESNYLDRSLVKKTETFTKVKSLPAIELKRVGHTAINTRVDNCDRDRYPFLIDDFAFMAENLANPVNNIQRFFIHPDYKTLAIETAKKISQLIISLKEIWQNSKPVPIKLNYHSASLRKLNQPFAIDCVIYPVCIYYHQKAFYLCGFGQTPREQSGWYNYRLDRIQSLEQLNISSQALPQYLEEFKEVICDEQSSIVQVQIEEIQNRLQMAYGFDFYRDDAEAILCFPADFDRSYNVNTFRHETFIKQTIKEIRRKINLAKKRSNINSQQYELLINKINKYSQQKYAFYTLQYRLGDYAVIRRLRDWSYHVEILLPWQLRQEISNDIATNWNRYKDDRE